MASVAIPIGLEPIVQPVSVAQTTKSIFLTVVEWTEENAIVILATAITTVALAVIFAPVLPGLIGITSALAAPVSSGLLSSVLFLGTIALAGVILYKAVISKIYRAAIEGLKAFGLWLKEKVAAIAMAIFDFSKSFIERVKKMAPGAGKFAVASAAAVVAAIPYTAWKVLKALGLVLLLPFALGNTIGDMLYPEDNKRDRLYSIRIWSNRFARNLSKNSRWDAIFFGPSMTCFNFALGEKKERIVRFFSDITGRTVGR